MPYARSLFMSLTMWILLNNLERLSEGKGNNVSLEKLNIPIIFVRKTDDVSYNTLATEGNWKVMWESLVRNMRIKTVKTSDLEKVHWSAGGQEWRDEGENGQIENIRGPERKQFLVENEKTFLWV